MPTAQCWRWVYKRETAAVQAITMCVHSQTVTQARAADARAFSARHVHRHDSKCTARVLVCMAGDSCVSMNTLYFLR